MADDFYGFYKEWFVELSCNGGISYFNKAQIYCL